MPVQFGSFVRLLFIVSNAFRDAISTKKDTRLMTFTRKEARGRLEGLLEGARASKHASSTRTQNQRSPLVHCFRYST